MDFSREEKKAIESILAKSQNLKRKGGFWMPLLNTDTLFDVLGMTEKETAICQLILFAGLNTEKTPDAESFGHLVVISGTGKNNRTIYLPEQVYRKFMAMNRALAKRTRSELVITSGYRSSAYQLLIFLRTLYKEHWSFEQTIKRVALPGQSEHEDLKNTALDFRVADRSYECFSATREYDWLCSHADRFGFSLSYPENNDKGFDFEPWHWRYVG